MYGLAYLRELNSRNCTKAGGGREILQVKSVMHTE